MDELTKYMPKPRVKSVTMTSFVDASHELDKKTIILHTGYLIVVNRSPIVFYSKRQSTVELSKYQVNLYP